MEYRGIEYKVVQGIEPGIWKWSVNSVRVQSGECPVRATAIARAKHAIDKLLAPKKQQPVPRTED